MTEYKYRPKLFQPINTYLGSRSLAWEEGRERRHGRTGIQQAENWKETGKPQEDKWPQAPSQLLEFSLNAKEEIGSAWKNYGEVDIDRNKVLLLQTCDRNNGHFLKW